MIHCIGANTKAGKGVAPLKKLLEAHVRVGLGTDGPSSGNTLDLFVQMRLLASFHKTWLHDRSAFTAKEIVRLATRGGSQALGLDDLTGSLEAGKKADLIIMDHEAVNMFPMHDPYSVLVYSAHAGNVRDVYVNGVRLVKNHQLTRQDVGTLRRRLDEEMDDFRIAAKKQSEALL